MHRGSVMYRPSVIGPIDPTLLLMSPLPRPSVLNLPKIINKKPVFVDPLNSSRHKYLQKKQTALPSVNLGPAMRMNSMMRMVKSKLLNHFD